MSKIILITGPTAVGKTALSIALAKRLNAQIINADSTQVYKDANIATAKITEVIIIFDLLSLIILSPTLSSRYG